MKHLYNIVTLLLVIIGIMTIGVFVHEGVHYLDVKNQTEIRSFSVWCFGECDDAGAEVTYYKNVGSEEVVSSELNAIIIQFIVVIFLSIFMFKSELFTNRDNHTPADAQANSLPDFADVISNDDRLSKGGNIR